MPSFWNILLFTLLDVAQEAKQAVYSLGSCWFDPHGARYWIPNGPPMSITVSMCFQCAGWHFVLKPLQLVCMPRWRQKKPKSNLLFTYIVSHYNRIGTEPRYLLQTLWYQSCSQVKGSKWTFRWVNFEHSTCTAGHLASLHLTRVLQYVESEQGHLTYVELKTL